ncbi:hypothetical protein [Bradyrhizobium sp. AZCC 2262]|uniref:hypothetical protein n=1 Tax=Bradyrhizobium sp. AZCC 2262 TaxID=3117022 RepID=UPI002FF24369
MAYRRVTPTDLWVQDLVTRRRKRLSLFRITRWIIAPIFPADVLSTRFGRWLFLSPLVPNDALLR